ncbi:hypothetical protein PIB30_016335 [Stylosanthes scabra]|uniref:Uncharacterized protein n=1 Tax=Stylosanthes scabra TaxID=79078 RepID=A0ABU6S740_9FABA|nr:hypothetical protein [Stylosanthes scabra]
MADLPQGEQEAATAPEVAAVQLPHELPDIYWWVTLDVLGAPSILDQEYLNGLKDLGVLFDAGELERRYRVCFLNLSHPRVPNWLWVNEVMFTEFGIQVPFSDFPNLHRPLAAASERLVGDPLL